MAVAVGQVVSGSPMAAPPRGVARTLSIHSNEFRELIGKLGPPLGDQKPVGRALSEESSNSSPRESEPRRPPLSSTPSPSEADPERASAGDPLPTWQPGAIDPLALFGVAGASAPPVASPVAPAVLDPLVSELLRSIAWGGDRRRGTARIELGSGRYGGTTLRVDVVGDRLQIDLQAPPGVDAAALGARLQERFEARGLRVDSVVLR